MNPSPLVRPFLWLRSSTLALPVAIVVAVLMISFNEMGYREARSQLARLVTMGQARLELTRVARRVTDAESGQRGYLLTGNRDYLSPYEDASSDARSSLAALQALYADLKASEEEAHRQILATAVNAKLSELAEVMKLHDAGRADAATSLLSTGIGRDQMEQIRQEVDQLLALQNRLISTGLSNIFGTLSLNRLGVAALTLLGLLLLSQFLRQSRLLAQERAAQQARVQDERDRLEQEVRKRTQELTELARHLETAREDERARLARDLHDELGALLTSAKLDVARLRPAVQQGAPEWGLRLAHLNDALNSGIALKRRIIEDLRPSMLDNLGLLPALQSLCDDFGERLGVPVIADLQPPTLSRSAELTVYRMVQESLTNVAKYAEAGEVRVNLHRDATHTEVSVQDNGRGFDPQQVPSARHGLLGMRYRIEAEGGQLLLRSAPGQGTRVQARLPHLDDTAAASPLPA